MNNPKDGKKWKQMGVQELLGQKGRNIFPLRLEVFVWT